MGGSRTVSQTACHLSNHNRYDNTQTLPGELNTCTHIDQWGPLNKMIPLMEDPGGGVHGNPSGPMDYMYSAHQMPHMCM